MAKGHKDAAPALLYALWDLRVDFVGIGGGSLLVLMIDTPHPVHTHSRSSLYIY
jgi:hypothetical protein